MNRINEICKEYEEARKRHYFSSWLNWPALRERILYFPQREHPNYQNTLRSDFIFDQKFLSSITENYKPTESELESWILYLKNHTNRITNRINFLLVYVALTGAFASLFKIIELDKWALGVLSVGLLATIIERSMLIDKKSTIEELTNLLEYEKSKEC